MIKYVVFGGFLGAGKTTSMLAFSEHIQSAGKGTPAILVNDLGAKNLVDGSFTATAECIYSEITGECICYQTGSLVDKLRRFRDEDHATVIFSDIPGCGIGALEHVYHKLNREYHGEFDLCPFVAVADPDRLRVIMPEHADLKLPPEMAYLFDAQLKEAELILLNKIDLLDDAQLAACMDFLTTTYTDAKIFPISAKDRRGIAEAVDYLLCHASELRNVDIGYGGAQFVAAEERLSWYNRRFYAASRSGMPFDGNAFTTALIDSIRGKLRALGRNVPHLKVFAAGKDDAFVKASLLGVDEPIQFDQTLAEPQTKLRAVINARAACESRPLDRLMDDALNETAEAFDADLHVFFTECFGMMDEGRV